MGRDDAPLWPVVNPTPRDPNLEWHVGSTFAPFTEGEWACFDWHPLWRVKADQFAVTERTSHTLLCGVDGDAYDDASIRAMLPFLAKTWGIELGNEPTLDDPEKMNAWIWRMLTLVRDTGWGGPIITPGIANLNDDTLGKAERMLRGLPMDVIFGWHCYDNCPNNIGRMLNMLNDRPHAMTESGYRMPTVESEVQVADLVRQRIPAVKASGSLTYVHYQTHDDQPGRPLNDMGLFALDGRLRQVAAVLEAASGTS